MKYLVQESFRVKTSQGERTIQAGHSITLPEDKAVALINAGKIKPEQQDAFEERAAIMQYDGGLSQEDAERLSHCFHVCMLTENQGHLCQSSKPLPCPRQGRLTGKQYNPKTVKKSAMLDALPNIPINH